jgi:RNA polymerase sigma-70 factor (ECF subfamily)
MEHEASLIDNAKEGGRAAFDALVADALPKVRGIVWRMVGHPDDCDDVVQDALVRAWQGIGGFDGRSRFSTWLVSIATRSAIDHLRAQKRWRRESQIAYANLCAASDELQGEVVGAMMEPEFTFDVKEHVAYCFVCLGRSLPPDEQAALVLREVMEFSSREAANVLGTSESVLRHRLAAARQAMEGRYDGLCALVSKTGMCHQCSGLSAAAIAVGSKATELPDIDDLAKRMAVIRGVAPEKRATEALHNVFFRRCKEVEEKEIGATVPEDCDGQPDIAASGGN